MKTNPKLSLFKILILITFVTFGGGLFAKSILKIQDKDDHLKRFEEAITILEELYVEEISQEELVSSALQGIDKIVDSYTTYFTSNIHQELKTQTKGSFGGVGILIGIRNKVLTIISPLEGTPASRAGIRSGDQIIEINDSITRNIKINDAVGKLRGKIGSKVKITIRRPGSNKIFPVLITRDKIKIESIHLSYMLNDSIGYIRMLQFSSKATQDLEVAIQSLKKQGMQKLIFDLRDNPGGLLDQSVYVSSLFLKKGTKVVSIRGRIGNQDFNSLTDPVWTKPLIVLVSQGSASASEIVAGAIQDNDRGLILGDTTFGKGSVQQVIPIPSRKEDAIKVTTAYYYTPSGRCINISQDHNKADSTVFFTINDRKVYGGGGIIPDKIINNKIYGEFIFNLEKEAMFFKYMIQNKSKIAKTYNLNGNFIIKKSTLIDFKRFVYQDSSFQALKNSQQVLLDNFYTSWKKSHLDSTSSLFQKMKKLKTKTEFILQKSISEAFNYNTDYISFALKRAFLQYVANDSHRKKVHEVQFDNVIQESVNYFEFKQYQTILNK